MDSILTSIKKLLGITEEYTPFDPDIIMHINSVFLTLYELGIGPPNGFSIEDDTAEWRDYISNNDILLGAVKSYMYLKVRMLFDQLRLVADSEQLGGLGLDRNDAGFVQDDFVIP